MRVSFRINGDPIAVEVEPRLHLADCLRDVLGLTGTHLGCEHGACGACTVIVDGAAVRACLMLTVQAEGTSVVTIEGLSSDEALSPLQTLGARLTTPRSTPRRPSFRTSSRAHRSFSVTFWVAHWALRRPRHRCSASRLFRHPSPTVPRSVRGYARRRR